MFVPPRRNAALLKFATTFLPQFGPFFGNVRGVRVVGYDDWRRIDAAEIERGAALGKPREKFVSVDEMLGVLQPR
jgi:hypothetical protein